MRYPDISSEITFERGRSCHRVLEEVLANGKFKRVLILSEASVTGTNPEDVPDSFRVTLSGIKEYFYHSTPGLRSRR